MADRTRRHSSLPYPATRTTTRSACVWGKLKGFRKSEGERFAKRHFDADAIVLSDVMRGHWHDDYPARAIWHALLAGIVFQHESLESLLRELARNPSLMDACGFDPLPIQRKPKPRVVTDLAMGIARIETPPTSAPVCAVPASWNSSRFLANVIALEETLGMISEMTVLLRAAHGRAARLRPVRDQAPRL